MRSPMIEEATYITAEDKLRYTDLRVLRSNAGYYIGTLYQHKNEAGDVQWEEPGSRDSDYFATEAAAQAELELIEAAAPGEDGLFREPKSNLF